MERCTQVVLVHEPAKVLMKELDFMSSLPRPRMLQ